MILAGLSRSLQEQYVRESQVPGQSLGIQIFTITLSQNWHLSKYTMTSKHNKRIELGFRVTSAALYRSDGPVMLKINCL
jgi:hypothetical protein